MDILKKIKSLTRYNIDGESYVPYKDILEIEEKYTTPKQPLVERLIKKTGIKNKHAIAFIILTLISYMLYRHFFIDWFDFQWRFIPVFLLGFITYFIITKFI